MKPGQARLAFPAVRAMVLARATDDSDTPAAREFVLDGRAPSLYAPRQNPIGTTTTTTPSCTRRNGLDNEETGGEKYPLAARYVFLSSNTFKPPVAF